MNEKIIKLSKEIYLKEPILKAAYIFSDENYVYVDDSESEYIVKIECKSESKKEIIDKEFINEVIAQTVRYNIMLKTLNIRELILGRALATTMINDSQVYENNEEDTNLDDILVNWFDKYDIK